MVEFNKLSTGLSNVFNQPIPINIDLGGCRWLLWKAFMSLNTWSGMPKLSTSGFDMFQYVPLLPVLLQSCCLLWSQNFWRSPFSRFAIGGAVSKGPCWARFHEGRARAAGGSIERGCQFDPWWQQVQPGLYFDRLCISLRICVDCQWNKTYLRIF